MKKKEGGGGKEGKWERKQTQKSILPGLPAEVEPRPLPHSAARSEPLSRRRARARGLAIRTAPFSAAPWGRSERHPARPMADSRLAGGRAERRRPRQWMHAAPAARCFAPGCGAVRRLRGACVRWGGGADSRPRAAPAGAAHAAARSPAAGRSRRRGRYKSARRSASGTARRGTRPPPGPARNPRCGSGTRPRRRGASRAAATAVSGSASPRARCSLFAALRLLFVQRSAALSLPRCWVLPADFFFSIFFPHFVFVPPSSPSPPPVLDCREREGEALCLLVLLFYFYPFPRPFRTIRDFSLCALS